MKRGILLLLFALAALPARSQDSADWYTDADQAQEAARRDNKFVLLDFTGSDWCVWCRRLKEEVFDQPEFARFAEQHLVLVEVDFPRHTALSQPQQDANNLLREKYHIRGYPTVILLGPDGREVGQTGYMEGGPRVFDAEVSRLLKLGPQAAKAAPAHRTQPAKRGGFVPIPPSVPNHYGALALKGISGTKGHMMVMINNANLMEGDTADVKVDDKEVVVCCKEIRDDSVLITVDGKPVVLKFMPH